MKRFSILFFFLCFSVCLKAQINPFPIGAELISANRYLKAIDTVEALKKQYTLKNAKAAKGPTVFDQALSFFLSTVGAEYPLKWKTRKRISPVSAVEFKPAYPYILDAVKTHQVVMVNEDHNTPKHRIFTTNLLNELYKEGFRYLCVEGLDEDSLINARGYPDFESGFYVCEPNMANLIRTAKSIGFKLISYDYDDGEEYTNENYGQHIREFNQAKNIQNILLADPKARILVHAGPGHIWEKGGDVIFMAEYFKMLTGIDPLTINQSVNAPDEYSTRLTGVLKGKPYVVNSLSGKPITSDFDHPGDYDLLVVWSPDTLMYGRQNALLDKSGQELYTFELPVLAGHNLLQILGTDASGPIPVDQFVVRQGVKTWATTLPAGNYKMQVVNTNGKIIWQKALKINPAK